MLDPNVWERQLQQELLLIQKQQQIQKELLISEFQKQHENLLRQHQAQLQEHLKLQQELQAMKQRQEQLEKERKLEQQNQERELERSRRQQQALILRSKERARESAVASTEVKQKLQEFLLNKSTKDPMPNGSCHALSHSSKIWLTASHHTSLEQSSPPLGGVSPSYRFPLPPLQDYRDDFPLRKTASEPNLKVRSRLKQKVAERRSSPLLRRKEGSVMTPFKKRALELMESSSSSSAPGSGPSSPNGASSALGTENGPSSLPTTTRTERLDLTGADSRLKIQIRFDRVDSRLNIRIRYDRVDSRLNIRIRFDRCGQPSQDTNPIRQGGQSPQDTNPIRQGGQSSQDTNPI
ncbi:hypothetical protein NFI96_009137 [Prochilodus magdalenae]|nr:hypothetical protein NFI96_009137 [Prochilodus magdalenae]